MNIINKIVYFFTVIFKIANLVEKYIFPKPAFLACSLILSEIALFDKIKTNSKSNNNLILFFKNIVVLLSGLVLIAIIIEVF